MGSKYADVTETKKIFDEVFNQVNAVRCQRMILLVLDDFAFVKMIQLCNIYKYIYNIFIMYIYIYIINIYIYIHYV